MMRRHVNGILLLDKPAGVTSNGVLQRVKRLFNAKKAGHTGSLDPLATGMLPLCFGEATKFSQFLLDANKTYHVVAKLGVQTNTGDSDGSVVAIKPVVDVTRERIQQVMAPLIGEIDQVPPMFSAIKVKGKPLYELARRGIEIERHARRITIFSLTLDQFADDQFSLQVTCSKGTYIRTLVEDIGKALGCGAHVIALRRTTVSTYHHAFMHTLPALEHILSSAGSDALLNCLLPVETAVAVFPAVKLTTAAAFYMRMGQPVQAGFPVNTDHSLVRLVAEDARFLGIGEIMPDGRVKPHRLLPG